MASSSSVKDIVEKHTAKEEEGPFWEIAVWGSFSVTAPWDEDGTLNTKIQEFFQELRKDGYTVVYLNTTVNERVVK